MDAFKREIVKLKINSKQIVIYTNNIMCAFCSLYNTRDTFFISIFIMLAHTNTRTRSEREA